MRPSASSPAKDLRKKELPSDKPAKKEPPSRDKPAKKAAAKPKPGTKPKAPPPAAPAEAPGEVPSHKRPAADRQKESPEEKAAPSVYTPATPDKPERKTEIATRVSAEIPVIWAVMAGTSCGAIARLGTRLTIPPPSVTGVLDGSDII
jgi:hypothetical protein